jgi:hypothetical protein
MRKKTKIYNREDQRLVVFQAYLNGYTPVEMGALFDMSRQRAYQIINENITETFQKTHELNRAKRIYESLKLKAGDNLVDGVA